MRKTTYGACLLALPLLWLTGSAQAANEKPRPSKQGVQIPVVSFLTQRFMFSGQYKMRLSREEMRIDHMADQSSCPMRRRTCLLSLAYTTPIGTRLGKGVFELPILGASHVTSRWNSASFGDYVAHFSEASSNTPSYSADLKLLLTLKF